MGAAFREAGFGSPVDHQGWQCPRTCAVKLVGGTVTFRLTGFEPEHPLAVRGIGNTGHKDPSGLGSIDTPALQDERSRQRLSNRCGIGAVQG